MYKVKYDNSPLTTEELRQLSTERLMEVREAHGTSCCCNTCLRIDVILSTPPTEGSE